MKSHLYYKLGEVITRHTGRALLVNEASGVVDQCSSNELTASNKVCYYVSQTPLTRILTTGKSYVFADR